MHTQVSPMPTGRTTPFDSDALSEQLQQLPSRGGQKGTCVVLLAPTSEQRRTAVVQLSEASGLNLHEYDMATLLADRPHQTQGNIRETFDGAREEAALLYFANADALYAADARQKAEEDLDDDAHTPVDYFHQRIRRFRGLVVLDLQDVTHRERLAGLDPSLTISF